jgi:hypothetical protein
VKKRAAKKKLKAASKKKSRNAEFGKVKKKKLSGKAEFDWVDAAALFVNKD